MIFKRIAEKTLNQYLKEAGAVLITGPKYCGKTFISNLVCKSSFILNNENLKQINIFGYSVALNGEKPRLIDEWQKDPVIWDEVRFAIDEAQDNKRGLYILTGSTKPINNAEISHSGAGRIYRMKLQTLTFAEIFMLEDNNSISLHDLFVTKKLKEMNCDINFEKVDELLLKGGWPEVLKDNDINYKNFIKNYIQAVISNDLDDSVKFNIAPVVFKTVLKSLARLTSSQLNVSKIVTDIKNELDIRTVTKYLDMLYGLDFIFEVPVWRTSNIRSKYKTRTKPKTYFCDTSIVSNLLSINSIQDFMIDGNTTGIIFENQVMKDLLVYTQDLGGELYFYHDENDNEIDAIIELDSGEWCAIEIKLTINNSMDAASELVRKVELLKMDGKHPQPNFMMIITNCDKTYVTKDGVFIVPHSLLRP